ncbi:hypothetical protein FB451DRAFT_1214175 [Mycena latifolia]|nr:hypothetical protein FB451DRAFT_1214175 [Mycena latifolia]
MTEYDYSPEGRARYAATQRRIASWARGTPSGPHLKSPFSPRSDMGSDATVRPGAYAYGGPSTMHRTNRTPTHHTYRSPTQYTYRSPTQYTYRPPTHAGTRSQATASSVTPSQSISQAPPPSHHTHASHRTHSSHKTHSSHHSRSQASSHGHRPSAPSTYVVTPPPGHAARGVIIFPRRGHPPSVVYY